MQTLPDIDTAVEQLDPPAIASRIRYRKFVEDAERIPCERSASTIQEVLTRIDSPASFRLAGPLTAEGGAPA